jgi:hypothetical protein
MKGQIEIANDFDDRLPEYLQHGFEGRRLNELPQSVELTAIKQFWKKSIRSSTPDVGAPSGGCLDALATLVEAYKARRRHSRD